jgi:catechol 2,3-dioxygenase-like lactoylglutathione lyase family enzyme
MRATRINHVSIVAKDLDESTRFYEELFGAERIPTARFPTPVQWLRIGDQQLHLFTDPENTPTINHHFGLDVDDFDDVYRHAKERGILDSEAFGAALRGHPNGWAHMYLRDPAGNLVEVCWPHAASLDPATLADLVPLESMARQEGEAAVATLYHS